MQLLLLAATLFLLCSNEGAANPVLIQNDDVSNCPPGYSQPAFSTWNKCYKIYTTYKNRKDAAAHCKRDNGTLAAIPDGFTNANIYSQATQASVTTLWLGIQCFNGNSKSCINDDNTNFGYNNFMPGQPTSEDICVYMSTIGRDSQKWSTFDCEQPFQFVCEVAVGSGSGQTTRPPTTTQPAATTTPKTKTCPIGWQIFQGMCYRKYDTTQDGGATRDEQSAQCKQTPGGNLASIHNKEVDAFLTNQLNCPNQFFRIGLSCPNAKFIGDTSTCVWDDGTPVNYTNFNTGQPQSLPSPNCGYSHLGFWYNDKSCVDKFECSACQAPMQ